MKHFMIKYQFANGTTEEWHREIGRFIAALDNDPELKGKIVYRCLKNRDPDVALKLADSQVQDWRGGTRIASCLEEFNQRWARRLLGANAALLLMTDGLDRDDHGDLAHAAAQLRRHAHRIVWLNPLLRFQASARTSPVGCSIHDL